MSLVRLPLTADFAEVAAALHAGSGLHEHWDSRAFADLLAMPGAGGQLALSDDTPVGLVLWRIAADEAEILTICVLPGNRRHGAGRLLLEGAIAASAGRGATRMILEVANDNAPALALYRRLEFRQAGRRSGYYRREGKVTDALILARDI